MCRGSGAGSALWCQPTHAGPCHGRHCELIPVTRRGVQPCLYRNSSDRMVILRCIGPESYFLEKVIFPFESWSFMAPTDADVELWCHGIGGAELLERHSSQTLLAIT